MADDSDVPPLPRRVPGASGPPRPSAGAERAAIPEDLRQRVLSAIAIELERDRAEQQRGAQGQGVPPARLPASQVASARKDGTTLVAGLAAVENPVPQTGADLDGTATPVGGAGPAEGVAPEGDASLAEGATPAGDAGLAEGAAAHGDASQAAALADAPTQAVGVTPEGGGTLDDATAPGRDQEEAAPRPSVFQPRRAPGANGALPPPQVRRGYLPPSLFGRRLDSEAHTEPLPRIGGFRADPAAMARTQPALPPAATPPAPAAIPPAATPPAATPPIPPAAGVSPAAAMSADASAPPDTVPPGTKPPIAAWPAAAPPRPRRQGRPYRIAGLILSVVALVAAGAVVLVLSGRTPAGHRPGPGAAAAVRNRAAAWVAGQVSRTAMVACDPVTCQALRAHGMPAGSLYPLDAQATAAPGAQIIVATAAVRAQLGYQLGSAYAPTVLASFGAGPDRIDIRQAASHGAAAYRAMLRAGLANRKASGMALLHSSRITATALARQQLAAGQVDVRLLLVIGQMARAHPMYIVGFGTAAPGASPYVPLRQVDLAENAHSHHHLVRTVSPGYVRSLVSFLYAQRGQFRPLRVQTGYTDGGAAVLRIEFAAPSPLGPLGPHA